MPGPTFSDELRAELKRAFGELRPHMVQNARLDADLDPDSRIGEFSEADLEQFYNAYQAMLFEAIDGKSRETRDLVLETALPPLLATGGGAMHLVRSSVLSGFMLGQRLVPLVREDLRHEAARWLAWFYSGYIEELVERTLEIEAGSS